MMIVVSYFCQAIGCASIAFSIFDDADDLYVRGMLLVILAVVIRLEARQ